MSEQQQEDRERWAKEVCTDFRIPFDDHKAGLRLAIVERLINLDERNKEPESDLEEESKVGEVDLMVDSVVVVDEAINVRLKILEVHDPETVEELRRFITYQQSVSNFYKAALEEIRDLKWSPLQTGGAGGYTDTETGLLVYAGKVNTIATEALNPEE